MSTRKPLTNELRHVNDHQVRSFLLQLGAGVAQSDYNVH